jgi:hypothetical protein
VSMSVWYILNSDYEEHGFVVVVVMFDCFLDFHVLLVLLDSFNLKPLKDGRCS